jgi:hypothetical protein
MTRRKKNKEVVQGSASGLGPAPAAHTGAQPSRNEIPPGATRKAFDRETIGGVTPGSPLGDRHMQGTPAGGGEFGGLAGSNVGHGEPLEEGEEDVEEEPGYGGISGGAVGGTPAGGRSSGGRIHRGFAPASQTRRGDSTIGGAAKGTPAGKKRKK